jgi:hypothetical protein
MYVNGDLEKDSYQRIKASNKGAIQRLQMHIAQLKTTDTNFMKYCRYGMSLLGNLDFHSFYLLYRNRTLVGAKRMWDWGGVRSASTKGHCLDGHSDTSFLPKARVSE